MNAGTTGLRLKLRRWRTARDDNDMKVELDCAVS